MGSPPRMRGKVQGVFSLSAWSRITPAYAGKSLVFLLGAMRNWDHPRMCGEKFLLAVLQLVLVGITPAYAGKSFRLRLLPSFGRDHPRTCGEKASR